MPVVKDLVPDLTNFYAQHRIDRAVAERRRRRHHPTANATAVASDDRENCSTACMSLHPVRLLLDQSCPSYWWNSDRYLGPATLLAGPSLAGRHVATRRPASASIIWKIRSGLYRCHTIMNCANACPKGLSPAKAIAELKKLMVERRV
jgi:succinate dehydrogenase / fumarate reductase iron-sulfur subunit